MINRLSIVIASALTLSTPASAFEIAFEWGPLKRCTSGNPNTVENPRFVLREVPEGTQFIRFRLKDRNVPSYNHGGGVVAYSGQEVIEPGAFKYKSPCPPSGSHTYEWTATAQQQERGGKLATAKAKRKYPE
jgi:hypothetical protein